MHFKILVKVILFELEKNGNKRMILSLCLYLSLARSDGVDCGSLICSFVDSSSERDATQRQYHMISYT